MRRSRAGAIDLSTVPRVIARRSLDKPSTDVAAIHEGPARFITSIAGIHAPRFPDWALSPLKIDTLGRHVGDRIEARFAPSPSVGRLGLLVHAPPLRVCRSARQQAADDRSEEHTSELQSLMRISYAGFCLTKNKTNSYTCITTHTPKKCT